MSSTHARTTSARSWRRAYRPTDSAMTRTASRGSMKQSGMTRGKVRPVSDGQTSAVLWGTDYEELGVVGSRSVGERAGLAITRGLHKKAYRYEDPNEDAVAAVVGEEATLLVCADGHNGATAPMVAVRAVLDALGPNPPAALSDGEWLDLFESVNDTVI